MVYIDVQDFPSNELATLCDIVMEGGGIKLQQMSPIATHYIVYLEIGQQLSNDRKLQLKSHNNVHIVSHRWLLDCREHTRTLPVDAYLVSLEVLKEEEKVIETHSKSIESKTLKLRRGSTLARSSKNDSSKTTPASTRSSTSVNVPQITFTKSQEGTVFDRKSFACEGFSDSRTQIIRQTVIVNGGRLDDEDSLVDFKVVSLATANLLHFQPQPSSQSSSSEQIVTECWIEACLAADEILKPDSFLMYRPLKIALPIHSFTGCQVVGVTGIPEMRQAHIRRLCELMGASCPIAFSRKNTVLLCSNEHTDIITGIKFEKAFLWKIPVVFEEWLYECVRRVFIITSCSNAFRVSVWT